MIRVLFAALLVALTASCATKTLEGPQADLGNFSLGHNVVVAPKMQKGPVSRDATEEEWTTALKSAMAARFGRYEGDKLYHLGISVEGYMLAPPGVPLVYTPKSALIINVTVWDDARKKKLNSKPYQIAVLESTNEDSILIGSGWGRSKQEQIDGLSFNAAYALEKWLAENRKTLNWFSDVAPLEPPKQERPIVEGN